MSMPQHRNPETADRIASAPYNFVPLPEKVVLAANLAADLPDHDRYYPDRLTGHLDVTLTTRSPMYIRGPIPQADYGREEEGADTPFTDRLKNRPDFFYVDPVTKKPVIPGSSLRGMLRQMVEVVGYGKVTRVTDKRLFFRTVDNTSLGRAYNRRMVGGSGADGDGWRSLTEGGVWCRDSDGDISIETREIGRATFAQIGAALGASRNGQRITTESTERDAKAALYSNMGPSGQPFAQFQYADVFVEMDVNEIDVSSSHGYLRFKRVLKLKKADDESRRAYTTGHLTGFRPGTVVLTGPIQGSHRAFVFVESDHASKIPVPNSPDEPDINARLSDLFHDRDQISGWQAQVFKDDYPHGVKRSMPGALRHGDPVFFLREKGALTFFGRAQMFRLPYQNRPIDLVPEQLRRPEDIDYADALFGYVRTGRDLEDMRKRGLFGNPSVQTVLPAQGDKRRAYAGRIRVTDAVTEDKNPFVDHVVVPQILASPKPTAMQHYLTQDGEDGKNLNLYDPDPDNAVKERPVLRGHKLYWHQGAQPNYEIHNGISTIAAKSTQHTTMRPVRKDVAFSFRIDFENLSPDELGALVWALRPFDHRETIGGAPNTQEYCHSLGMGKPLGLGAVKLEATLNIHGRSGGNPGKPDRYGALFDDSGGSWLQHDADTPSESLVDRNVLKQRIEPFEHVVLNALGVFGGQHGLQHLSQLARIGVLLKMMEWPGQPSRPAPALLNSDESGNNIVLSTPDERPNTRYMRIDISRQLTSVEQESNPQMTRRVNEYRPRRILPSPFDSGQEATRPVIARRPFGSLSGYRVPESQVPAQVENGSVEDRALTEEELRILSDLVNPERAPAALAQGDVLAARITNVRGDGYDCELEAPGKLVGDLRYGEAIPNRSRALPVGTRIQVKIRKVISSKKYFLTMKGIPQEAITNQ